MNFLRITKISENLSENKENVLGQKLKNLISDVLITGTTIRDFELPLTFCESDIIMCIQRI